MNSHDKNARPTLVIDARLPFPARRLEQVVQQLLRVGRAQALEAIHQGAVTVNRRVVRKPQVMLEIGDRVTAEVLPPPPPALRLTALRQEPVRIIFEDDSLLVVRKPAGLLTVPTPHREKHTLISELAEILKARVPAAEPFCVHRLDRGVSGLLVFAKSLEVAEALRNQFAARKPKRVYIAFVHGVVREDRGTIRSFLATDAALNRYSTNEGEGELAITHFEVVDRFEDVTRLSIELETGRRNQIRIHLAELGHPVLGDDRYGRGLNRHRAWPFKRIALHAETLGLQHPVTQRPLSFETPLPKEFHRLLEKLRPSP